MSHSQELRDAFDLFDSDGSGSISTNEMSKVCESLDIRVNADELNSLMKLMDRDGSGTIDFDEFVNIMADQFYRPPTQRELEEAFNYFDKGTGLFSQINLFITSNPAFSKSVIEAYHINL